MLLAVVSIELLTTMLTGMVRVPLSPEQVKAGQRLGALIRTARAGRDPEMIARNAGISPETLRKIEVGRMPSPSFGIRSPCVVSLKTMRSKSPGL